MNGPLSPMYTNEVSPEFLRSLDGPDFTEQQIAQFAEQSQAIVRQQESLIKAHPTIAIFRFATEGSQTRDGGVIQRGAVPVEITLEDGRTVRLAHKGDHAIYADGSTAQIVTGSGDASGNVALVGSLLGNGDQIINTPQGACIFHVREGVPMDEDFLPAIAD
ncbi:hypothetical protein EI969_25550 [Pseudomonas sp. PB101]|nr:hypothetical protein [Pseudomonas sp. PB101]